MLIFNSSGINMPLYIVFNVKRRISMNMQFGINSFFLADGTNSRSSKRGSKEATLTPSTKENETRFTVGSSEPTTQLSAKKKLNMSNAGKKEGNSNFR